SDIPEEVDIAIIFPNDEVQENFWKKLPEEIKILKNKDIAVARTLFVDALIKDDFFLKENSHPLSPFEKNNLGYMKRANDLYSNYLFYSGITGVVIDVDHSLDSNEIKVASGVWHALYKKMKLERGDSTFMIYDHDILLNFSELFSLVSCETEYVFVDCYGKNIEEVTNLWNRYKNYISPSKFVVGFSFYEEYGERWRDTTDDLNDSRIEKLVNWQPNEGNKGGVFAYAADRDGVSEGEDKIIFTNFNNLKEIKSMLSKSEGRINNEN
ncbi:EndoS/ChiA family endoglycosidase, partial [Enterococcus sp. DIV0086]